MAHRDQNKRDGKGGHRSRPQQAGFTESSDAHGHSSKYLKNSMQTFNPSREFGEKLTIIPSEAPSQKESKEKKQSKTKYVNLYGEKGQERAVLKLPGRHECNCQASMHALVNNCLKCGRIICEQEGSGSCFFCSTLVCTKEEQMILDRGGKKAEEMHLKLVLLPPPKSITARKEEELAHKEEELVPVEKTSPSKSRKSPSSMSTASSASRSKKDFDKGLEKALAEKDRLLDYQKNSARRTMVYDDESDYFNTDANRWLSKEEREKLRKREEELRAVQNMPRSQRRVTLDIAGRQVLDEQPSLDFYNPEDSVVQQIYFSGGAITDDMDLRFTESDDIHRPGFFRPTYAVGNGNQQTRPSAGRDSDSFRLQDGTLQGLSDQGKCLSMHQPYASLLVCGIKKHEGRSWYTSHRGPLWIASTAKHATPEEIGMVENFYRASYDNASPASFPSHYPSSCLLGCVIIVDCLAQEQYQELYPNGESESAYVWICKNPRELTTHFPIRGQHKIYKLDPAIHQAAKKMIGK